MKTTLFILLIISIFLFLNPAQLVIADESQAFFKKGNYWYDSWDVNRNIAGGNDGYLPALVYESLGQNRELAYQFGRWFLNEYSNRVTRAEKIMKFVQSMVKYKYDEENEFILSLTNNEKQVEWAWNPDEMAHMIDWAYNNQQVAHGDCEDFAFILTVIYIAAGYNVTIVDAPKHVALLIWLPEYPNANVYWDINDDMGSGWIWVEATGDKNRLGWTPDDYKNVEFQVHELETGLFLLIIMPNNLDCMVTIATIGSELYREVQFIKEFRDNLIKSTYVGNHFTEVFNAWYYSFSPEVAAFIAKNPVAKDIVKGFLYPLLGIMRVSNLIYHFLAFNSELGVVLALFTASFLIGAVYFTIPMMSLFTFKMYGRNNERRIILTLIIPLLTSFVMIGLSCFINLSFLMTISSAMLVLTTVSASAFTLSIKLLKLLHAIYH